MNLGQLTTAVGRKFSLSTDTSSDDYAAMVTWANEAVTDVMLRTRCFVDVGDMTLSPPTNDYRLDNEILVFIDAHIISTTTSQRFERRSVMEIMEMRRNTSTTGDTAFYAVNGNLLMVYPTPTSATTVRYYFAPRPETPLAGPTDDPSTTGMGDIPVEYHKALETYMMWQAAEAQGDFSGQLLQEYERQLNRIRWAMALKGGKPARARLAPLYDTRIPRDPSVVPRY